MKRRLFILLLPPFKVKRLAHWAQIASQHILSCFICAVIECEEH